VGDTCQLLNLVELKDEQVEDGKRWALSAGTQVTIVTVPAANGTVSITGLATLLPVARSKQSAVGAIAPKKPETRKTKTVETVTAVKHLGRNMREVSMGVISGAEGENSDAAVTTADLFSVLNALFNAAGGKDVEATARAVDHYIYLLVFLSSRYQRVFTVPSHLFQARYDTSLEKKKFIGFQLCADETSAEKKAHRDRDKAAYVAYMQQKKKTETKLRNQRENQEKEDKEKEKERKSAAKGRKKRARQEDK
jgi:hypothetical protein